MLLATDDAVFALTLVVFNWPRRARDGWVIGDGSGLRSLYPVGAALTLPAWR
ncbi:hypothetical protein AB0H00_27065 [Nocardia sp. NPDC023852]|uniref:hypothetical protein n=1 Tax=Nocardia sp. NPDC023852 TaxID=3154697 RepID=UPI0033ECA241